MATPSSILAWEIPWTVALAGYSPWGPKESDTTKRLSTQEQPSQRMTVRCPRPCSHTEARGKVNNEARNHKRLTRTCDAGLMSPGPCTETLEGDETKPFKARIGSAYTPRPFDSLSPMLLRPYRKTYGFQRNRET